MYLTAKKTLWKKSTETLPDKIWGRFLFFPVFTIITIIAMIMTFQYTKMKCRRTFYILSPWDWL